MPPGTGTTCTALFLIAWACGGSVCMPALRGGDPRLEDVRLPPGFSIHLYADSVDNARAMCWGDAGTLFVGSRDAGLVHALRDTNGDGTPDRRWTIAHDLKMPAGVAFHDGALYVSAVDRILRFDAIEQHLDDPPDPVVVTDQYPTETHHGWKFIAFGPDGLLYVPVGAPCNICESEDPIYASITRIRPDGSGREIVARGVRNTVGFDWSPEDSTCWFTDNGRDWAGDDRPNDELDHLTAVGQHFGYPYCHEGDWPDPEFGKGHDCADFVPPAAKLGPHVAALGMRFYRGTRFPEKYRHAIFIAEHGSWNRSTPIGYRIAVAFPKADGTADTEVFAEGWLQGNRAWGRPVDVLNTPDGDLLVSDDAAGVIYRITYTGP
ncbi:MAG: sorbosone dehydrogenase family protein [Flavobacteriales bacterium]|nr:sorbosone dehydrogenase family protein [Flavobacteriales bacterium]MCB9193794.1 sorbosone dehydrogenase family protein [Flavobacteriales bacterium]